MARLFLVLTVTNRTPRLKCNLCLEEEYEEGSISSVLSIVINQTHYPHQYCKVSMSILYHPVVLHSCIIHIIFSVSYIEIVGGDYYIKRKIEEG